MNERIKIKVKQMLDRGAKGLLRFRMAFLLPCGVHARRNEL